MDNYHVHMDGDLPLSNGPGLKGPGIEEEQEYEQVSSLSVQVPTTDHLIVVNPVNPAPPAYVGRALFVTLCCCMPLGAVALMKSSQVRQHVAAGDAAAAHRASFEARQWSMAGLFIGSVFFLVGTLTYLVLFVIIILTND